MNKTNNRPVVNHPKNSPNQTQSAPTPNTTPTRSSPNTTGPFSYAQRAKQSIATSKQPSTDSKTANSPSISNGAATSSQATKSTNTEVNKPAHQKSTSETKPINIKSISGVKLPQFPGSSTPRSNIQFGSIDQPNSGVPSPSTSPVHRNSFISQDSTFPTFGTAVKNGSIDSVAPGVRITAQKPQLNRTISQKESQDSPKVVKDVKPQSSNNSESSPSLNNSANQPSSNSNTHTNKVQPSPQSFGHPTSHYNKGSQYHPHQPSAAFPQPPPNASYPNFNPNQPAWHPKGYPTGPINSSAPINPNYNHSAGTPRPRDRSDPSPNANPSIPPGSSPNMPHNHGSPAWQPSYYQNYQPNSMGYDGPPPYYIYNQGVPPTFNPPIHGVTPSIAPPSLPAVSQHQFNTNAPSFVPGKTSKAIKIVNPISKEVVDPAATAATTSSTQSPTGDLKAQDSKSSDTKPATPNKDEKVIPEPNSTEIEAQKDKSKDTSDKATTVETKVSAEPTQPNTTSTPAKPIKGDIEDETITKNYIINQSASTIPITLSYVKPGISKAIKITPPPAAPAAESKPVEQVSTQKDVQIKAQGTSKSEPSIPNGESSVSQATKVDQNDVQPKVTETQESKPSIDASQPSKDESKFEIETVTENSKVDTVTETEAKTTVSENTADSNDASNLSTLEGTLRYQRDYLLSFKDKCTIKPTNMKPIEDIVVDSPSREGERKSMAGRRTNSSHHGRFSGKGDSGSFDFNVAKSKTTSEERFKLSTQMQDSNRHPLGQRSSSGGPSNNMGGHGGMGHFGKETRSSRGRGGDKNRRYNQQGGPTIPLDQVVPLEKSENRWVPVSTQAPKNNEIDDEEKLARQIKASLNKLTLEKFEPISNQILEIANQSVSDNGLALRTVIYLIFEKATDEANFGAIYAKLCQKILENLDSNVKDDNYLDKEGNHVLGGNLFRKYLLMRCQSEFEKGWKLSDEYKEKVIVDYSDEYYAAAKAKRRGLGLVRFIGELFKQNMLSSRIMHECIQRLLSSEIPEEEEVESLTKLMGTVGPLLDQREDSKKKFDLYFDKVASLAKNPALPSRHRFMLKDLIDLRKDRWVPRNNTNSGPKTIAQIHQDAQKEKEQNEILKRVNSAGPRGPSLAQHGRSYSGKVEKAPRNTDGWNTISSSTTNKKIGDLTSFGNFDRSKASSQNLGPSSNNVFDSLQNVKPAPREKESPVKKTQLTNMFDMLNDDDLIDTSAESASKARSEPKVAEPAPIQEPTTTTTEKLPTSPEAIKRRIDATITEFFSLKDFTEAKLCFQEFEQMNVIPQAIQSLISSALEKKTEDVELVVKLINKFHEDNFINDHQVYVEALTPVMETVEDLSYDVPQIYTLMGTILAGVPSLKFTDLPTILAPLLASAARLPPGPKLVAAYINTLKKTKTEQDIINQANEENFDISTLGPKFADHFDLKFLVKESTTN